MNIEILSDSIKAHLINEKALHPLQSYEWGEARKKTGVDIVRLTSDTDVFTMTLHPIPYTSYKIGYIPRSVMPTTDILTFLQEWGSKNSLIFIKFEPYVEKSTNYKLPATSSLTPSTHPLFPAWTQILDLIPAEEELLKNMKQKTRYNIRLAEKKGVVVKEMSTDEGFEIFSELYFATCARQKYHGHTPEYHKIVWNALKGNIAKILIAYYENEPLAAYELFLFKDRWYYPYGGSADKHRNLMAANLLMWEAIRLGKRLGAKTFDMWGSLPPHSEANGGWAGFTRFKEGYGTRYVEFVGSYDLVILPIQYRVYNSMYSLRNMYLKLRA